VRFGELDGGAVDAPLLFEFFLSTAFLIGSLVPLRGVCTELKLSEDLGQLVLDLALDAVSPGGFLVFVPDRVARISAGQMVCSRISGYVSRDIAAGRPVPGKSARARPGHLAGLLRCRCRGRGPRSGDGRDDAPGSRIGPRERSVMRRCSRALLRRQPGLGAAAAPGSVRGRLPRARRYRAARSPGADCVASPVLVTGTGAAVIQAGTGAIVSTGLRQLGSSRRSCWPGGSLLNRRIAPSSPEKGRGTSAGARSGYARCHTRARPAATCPLPGALKAGSDTQRVPSRGSITPREPSEY
jgi:hypothetical protein